jgi:hypothetical protein
MQLATMPDSTWTVTVKPWTWIYTFSSSGSVQWRDPFNGMSGKGTWNREGDKLVTRWHGSTTVEWWDVPIETSLATGICTMKGKKHSLTAVATSVKVIESEAQEVFTRTPASRARFLERCTLASGKLQVADLHFRGWCAGIAIAYGNAYAAHNKILDQISARERLAADLLLGAALALLGGGAGGLIGGTMKKANCSEWMIDAIKDLGKFGVRGPATAVLRPEGLKGMPTSPLQWQNEITERVTKEMAVVAQVIDDWRMAIDSDDDQFDASFDPVTVVEAALTLNFSNGRMRIPALPDVDKPALQRTFEMGWLEAWIKLRKCPVLTRNFARANLMDYGVALGMNADRLEQLLDRHCPEIDTRAIP